MNPLFQAPALVKAVAVLLTIEALAVFWVFFTLLLELISGNYQNIYAEIFLVVLALASGVWVLTFTRQLLAKKRWARSAAFFWQLMQAAVGAGALGEGNLTLGIFLVALATASVVLLFNRQVIEATNEQAEG